MGVTDYKDITVAACQNWKSNIKSEDNAREAWRGNWGWIQAEYKDLHAEVEELLDKRQKVVKLSETKERRTVRPFPMTTAKDIGWLSSRREFLLDIYGPYPYTRPSQPPLEPPPLK